MANYERPLLHHKPPRSNTLDLSYGNWSYYAHKQTRSPARCLGGPQHRPWGALCTQPLQHALTRWRTCAGRHGPGRPPRSRSTPTTGCARSPAGGRMRRAPLAAAPAPRGYRPPLW
eukprot:6466614-Pyramimonas_sp.AAC.1